MADTRGTAVYLAGYLIFFAGFFAFHQTVQYEDWRWLFSLYSMQVATILALLALAWHAWIGIEIVLTDYIKPAFLRSLAKELVLLVLGAEVIWVILIMWGN